MNSKSRLLLVTAVIIIIFGFAAYYNQTKPRILIIHSYYTDFSWVNEVNDGIKSYLKTADGMGKKAIVRYQYLDLRRHPHCDFYRSSINDARLVIASWKPQVIIVVDDIGQDLLGSQYLVFRDGYDADALYKSIADRTSRRDCPQKFPNAETARQFFNLKQSDAAKNMVVIFAGVNGDVENYGYYEAQNVAGIFERKNFSAIKQTIEDLYRASPEGHKPERVQIVSDDSPSALAEKPLFEELARQSFNVPLAWEPVRSAKNTDEWQAIVRYANRKNAILLVANYGKLSKDAPIIAWSEENAAYPMLGAATSFVNEGGMLTFAVPGYEQGQVSIQLALQALQNMSESKDPMSNLLNLCFANQKLNQEMLSDPKPFCSARQFLVGMNKSLVTKRQLTLPLIYESFSRQTGNYREK